MVELEFCYCFLPTIAVVKRMPVYNRADTEFWCRCLQEAVPVREIVGLWVIRLAGVPKVETTEASVHGTFAEF